MKDAWFDRFHEAQLCLICQQNRAHWSGIRYLNHAVLVMEGIMAEHVVKTTRGKVISNPPIACLLFDDTRLAWLWLLVRLWVGYQWLSAGLSHLSDPKWMAGDELKAFWTSAVQVPANGRPPIAFDWYR